MIRSENITFLLHLLFYFVRKRRFSRSTLIDFCRTRLEKRPRDVLARRVLARLYAHGNRDFPKAVAEYKKLIDQGEESLELYKALGLAQRNMGDFSGAIATFQQAERVKPCDLTILAELGYAYIRAEMYPEALEVLEKAIQIGHPPGLLNHYRGFCFLKLGKHERAVEEYEKALAKVCANRKLAKEAAMAHTNLGIQLFEEKKWDLATQEFHRAIELDADYLEAVVGLSKVMLGKDEFERAVELGTKIISKKPMDYRGYLIVASALQAQGKASEAIEMCEKGKIQSNDPDGSLSAYLTRLYRSLG
jgi:tetratricopeptide (TPR) repeat protein